MFKTEKHSKKILVSNDVEMNENNAEIMEDDKLKKNIIFKNHKIDIILLYKK